MSQKERRRRSGRRSLMGPAALVGSVFLILGLGFGPLLGPANSGSMPASGEAAQADPTGSAESTDANSGPEMDRSKPVSLKVPAMGLREQLLELGTKKDGDFVELPAPARAGWFTESVTPGEVGIATVVGYIRKSENQPGVFSNLGDLAQGDKISVKREDGSKAVFDVGRIETYAEGKLPESEVYGQTDRPELRLITSGGKLHPDDPAGNVVVYAHLVDSR